MLCAWEISTKCDVEQSKPKCANDANWKDGRRLFFLFSNILFRECGRQKCQWLKIDMNFPRSYFVHAMGIRS